MKGNTMEKVIFSVDTPADVHSMKMFYRLVDDLRAVGKLTGPVIPCIGCVDGAYEPSWMMNKVDFDRLVRERYFMQQQKCFLLVPGDVRQPCVLEYQDGSRVALGPMKQVDPANVRSWTMRLDDKSFWGC